jgi:Fic family protein
VPIARLLARSEGISSSFFEGISSPATEVAMAVSQRGGSPAAIAVAENVNALATAMSQSSGQFSIELLHEWHRILMTHATYLPGEMIGGFRTQQGWIGGSSPLDAALVTAPPEYLNDLMNDLVMFINDRTFDPISQAAIAHAQFETIHPYGDGNGRVGRVLIAWMLTKRLELRVAPPVSVHLSRDRGGYLSGLVMFQQGQIDPWIRWFADTVARAATSASEIALGESQLSHLRSDAVARRILPLFPERYVVTSADVVTAKGVSGRAARAALAELKRIGICEELFISPARVGRPEKLWVSPELAALLPR